MWIPHATRFFGRQKPEADRAKLKSNKERCTRPTDNSLAEREGVFATEHSNEKGTKN